MQLSQFYKRSIIYIGMLLFPCYSFSAEQEKFLHFTEVDGLPRNITTCLEQDQYGYLWVGTTNGIARYDGKNFYSYKELTGISIIYLLYDSHHTLWVASGNGLFKYNRLTNYFNRVTPGFITKVQEDKGGIYFLMMSSVYKVEGNKILRIYQGNELSDFCFSKEGIWLGKSIDGVCLLSRESGFKKITSKYLINQPVNFVSKIDNNLFVAHYNGQLYSLSDNGKLEQIEIHSHYFLKKITKVGNEFWLATDGNGIVILDKNLHFSRIMNRNITTDASINSNSIYDIYCSKNNEIWVASFGAGLTCILSDNLLFKNILPEKGNDNSLIANEGVSLYVKKPFIYFGTNYGLSVWNEYTQKFKNLSSG
ncbi:MAG TPA: two-component regulator propeller domain-containing protein, partial [Bacteroidales bacterium]